MKKRYVDNGYTFILSNNYDKISKVIHECMRGMRVPCKYCGKLFLTKEARKTHYKVIHRIGKPIYIYPCMPCITCIIFWYLY